MVKRDVDDDAEHRRDNVCAVESPAKSHLHHCDVDLLARKMRECHGAGQLKERWVAWEMERLICFYPIGHVTMRNHDTIHLDALTKVDQMRRGEQPYPIAGALQHGCKHVRNRPFAIGACHMDDGIVLLRVVKECCQASAGI